MSIHLPPVAAACLALGVGVAVGGTLVGVGGIGVSRRRNRSSRWRQRGSGWWDGRGSWQWCSGWFQGWCGRNGGGWAGGRHLRQAGENRTDLVLGGGRGSSGGLSTGRERHNSALVPVGFTASG
jgi:hypothetical protein